MRASPENPPCPLLENVFQTEQWLRPVPPVESDETSSDQVRLDDDHETPCPSRERASAMLPLWLLICQWNWTAAAVKEPVRTLSPTPVSQFTFAEKEDADADGFPDNWVRRKGPGFPRYIPIRIDDTVGQFDTTSLAIQANGAAATCYSALIPIDGLHTFYFSGAIRTRNMQHDAALISVSLLNHRRERLQRFVSEPVMGTHQSWVPIDIGPITPSDGVRFAIIGCHLSPGSDDRRDLQGTVWFDDLQLGRLPRIELTSNFFSHLRSNASPVRIDCRVSGLDAGYQYEIEFELKSDDGSPALTSRQRIEADPETESDQKAEFLEPQIASWEVQPQPPGFYRVRARLHRDGKAIADERTSLAVVQLIEHARPGGEFGWSLNRELPERERQMLPGIASQSGINWLKYPLWRVVRTDDPLLAGQVATMFDRLTQEKVAAIAVLSEPPENLRQQFARDWQGVSEVFNLPPHFWQSSLEPVIARFSSTVNYWQLGSESDSSFQGSSSLPETLQTVRKEVQRISLSATVGLPWTWDAAPPKASFLSLSGTSLESPAELKRHLQDSQDWPTERWVMFRLSQLPQLDSIEAARVLALWMIAAKTGKADRIFIDDVYHDQHGLLHADGSPTPLFLPWRTVAVNLQGSVHQGSFHCERGSRNEVFMRDQEATIVMWNDEPVTEELFLGNDVVECDLWGRIRTPAINPQTGESILEIGPVPKFFLHCSEPVARLRLAAKFELGRTRSEYGGHNDAIIFPNTFPQGASGVLTLQMPPEWDAEPRMWNFAMAKGETVRLPTFIRLPPNTSLGEQPMTFEFQIEADRPYRLRIHQSYIVGLGEVTIQVVDRKLPDGRLEVEQIVTNQTNPAETLDFRCSLFIPDARRQKLQITKLGPGVDRKFYFLPNADRYRGQSLWLRLEQDGGRRIMNYRWVVGKDW